VNYRKGEADLLPTTFYGAMPGVTLPSWDLSVSPYIITSPLALVRVLFQRSISHYFEPHLLFIETSLVCARAPAAGAATRQKSGNTEGSCMAVVLNLCKTAAW
jgi:hypothetical protein